MVVPKSFNIDALFVLRRTNVVDLRSRCTAPRYSLLRYKLAIRSLEFLKQRLQSSQTLALMNDKKMNDRVKVPVRYENR